MFNVQILKAPITRAELRRIATDQFGDMVKAVVDVRTSKIGIGGELHVDIEAALMETAGSLREDTWGINLYPDEKGEAFIEYDSMVNLKPASGNRTRNVENAETRKKIEEIVKKYILE